MPVPRGSTMRGTDRSKNAEANLRSRQRFLAQEPDTIQCPVCGQWMKPMGSGSHRRQHILNGEIDAELPFRCGECDERYETKASYADHRRRGHNPKKKTAADHPDRVARCEFVNSIVKLPYREFVERLLA